MLLLLCPVLLETYMNVSSFQQYKQAGHSISMVTCYDHWSAKILNKSDIDCLLVGDSLAVVMHGFDSTIHATIEMMMMHVAAVARGATEKFIIADMPFLSCSKGLEPAMDAVQQLMHAGAHAVKIEGASHQLPLTKQIDDAGAPVMASWTHAPVNSHNGWAQSSRKKRRRCGEAHHRRSGARSRRLFFFGAGVYTYQSWPRDIRFSDDPNNRHRCRPMY